MKVECPQPYLNSSYPNTINNIDGKHGPFTLQKEMQNVTWQYVVTEAGKHYCWDDSDEFNHE